MTIEQSAAVQAILVGECPEELLGQLRRVVQEDSTVSLAVAPSAESLRDVAVDVVVLTMEADDAFPQARLAAVRAACDAPVMLIAATENADLLRRAAAAGVQDVACSSQSPAQLAFALHRTAAFSGAAANPADTARSEGSRVITVMSLKGGTGSSTVAVNTAATCAAHLGLRTLLIDLDLWAGDAALALGMAPQHTIADLALSPGDLDAAKVRGHAARHSSGIELLAAPRMSGDADIVRPDRLLDVLQVARDSWDVVVVDTAAHASDHLVAALDSTDELVMVVSPEVAAVKEARNALALLQRINFPEQNARLVLNRAGSKVGLSSAEVADTVERRIDFRIPSDRLVPGSWNEGIPVVVQRPTAEVSRSLERMTVQFLPNAATLTQRLPGQRGSLRALLPGRRREAVVAGTAEA